MEIILIRQSIQMFVLIGIGWILFRTGKVNQDGSRILGNILIYVSIPAVIISSFLEEKTPESLSGFLWSIVLAVVLLLLSVLVAHFTFRKDPIGAFAAAFSSPGFFGIPLMIASVGQHAVFYSACFVALVSAGQWTYGVSRLTGQPVMQGFRLKKLIRSPFVIAILIGFALFLSQLRLPDIIRNCLTAVAGVNTPLAMFTVGIYMAQTDFEKMVRDKAVYRIAAVRLILIPVLTVFLLKLFPASMIQMKTVLLLAAASPVGSNVAVYAQLYGRDSAYAVEAVVVSTLLSVITVPAVVFFAKLIW